jgi:hypothetical protein
VTGKEETKDSVESARLGHFFLGMPLTTVGVVPGVVPGTVVGGFPGVVAGGAGAGNPGKSVGKVVGSTVGSAVGIPDGIVMGGNVLGSGSGNAPPSRGAVPG